MNSTLAEAIDSRRDPIAQFLKIQEECQKENQKAEGSVEISADTSRAYFPTQNCSARFRVKEELFDKGCSEIKAEFRGEIHSFTIVSNGQTTYVSTATNYLFSYEVQLYDSKNESSLSSGADPFSNISFQSITSRSPQDSQSSSLNSTGGVREWIVSSRLPEKGSVKRRGAELQIPLPSTFRDHRYSKAGGINYISYGWKMTAEMKGFTKRNKRFWLPILVLPLSYSRIQATPTAGPSQDLPGYANDSSTNGLPPGWKFERVQSRIKKGLIFSKGRIELKFSSPPVSTVSMSSALPFLLAIKVSSSTVSDLLPTSESSILPELPWAGPGESHPKFELRRKDVSKGQGGGSSGLHTSRHTMPLEVEWADGHLDKGVGMIGKDTQNSEFQQILALASPWSPPSRDDSTESSDHFLHSSYHSDKKEKSKEFDDSDSESISSTEGSEKKSILSKLKFTSKGKGKDKEKDDERKSDQDYSTTATISGFLPTFFTPSISVNHIKTSYRLRLRWKCKGLGNDLSETFKEIDLNDLQTGIFPQDVENFISDPESLSNRALGWRAKWLKEPNTDSTRELGEQLEMEVGAMKIQSESLPTYSSK